MCGILGILQLDGSAADRAELLRLSAGIVHRGPDGDGMFVDGAAGLAMRRLAIIDLQDGSQPMVSEDGAFVIVYNGECYNHAEIRAELERRGRRFRTHSDTEVVLIGYQEWGAAILDRMIGMWGFAIYDRRRQELFLARDRLGKKQLYYAKTSSHFAFGSEMGIVLKACPGLNRLRPGALQEFLTYGYVSGPETAVDGIRLIPEGCWATVTLDGTLTIRRYWDLADIHPRATPRTEAEAAEGAYELLRDSVRRRLVSDVPVSLMLSSGLDSSSIAHVLAIDLGAPLQAFSIGYSDSAFDESSDAGNFAAAYGLPWERTIISGSEVLADFPKLIEHGSSLQGNTAQIVYYFVNKMIRCAGYKVALNGSGGDELFAGYPTYRAATLFSAMRHLPRSLRGSMAAAAAALPTRFGRVTVDYALKKFTACPYDTLTYAHAYWRTIFDESELKQLLAPAAFRAEQSFTRPYDQAFAELGSKRIDINELLKADLKAWLIPMLPWVDNTSMAHSVELRLPYLDHRLVEYALSMPSNVLFRGWRLKRLMKRFLERRLPVNVLRRRKRGTHLPLSRWLNGELREHLNVYLASDRLTADGVFDARTVRRLIAEHAEARVDNTFRLWNLLVFAAWKERYGISV